MAAKRATKRKRIKPRNPLVPIVRGKRAAVEPAKRAYTRKTKHKTEPDAEGKGDA